MTDTTYSASGGGAGFGFGGFGGWGIPPVGLFGLTRGGLFGGDGFDGRRGRDMEECCCDIRADIGETKFKIAETTLTQTNALMKELCDNASAAKDNTFQVERELFGIQKDILQGNNGLEKSILIQGFENQLATSNQTNQLSRQIADCCCETNLNIERTAHATQLRDLENRCHIDSEIANLKNGQAGILAAIANQAKETKIELLEKELRQADKQLDRLSDMRIAAQTNCLVTQLGDANKTFFGPTYPWSIPTCPSC